MRPAVSCYTPALRSVLWFEMWRKLVFDLQLQLFSSSKLTIGENNYFFILINTGPIGKFIYRSSKLLNLFAIIYRLQLCEYISEERTCLLEKAMHNLILCNSKNIYLPGNSPWANGHLTQEPCLVVNWNQRNQLGKLIFLFQSVGTDSSIHNHCIPEKEDEFTAFLLYPIFKHLI